MWELIHHFQVHAQLLQKLKPVGSGLKGHCRDTLLLSPWVISLYLPVQTGLTASGCFTSVVPVGVALTILVRNNIPEDVPRDSLEAKPPPGWAQAGGPSQGPACQDFSCRKEIMAQAELAIFWGKKKNLVWKKDNFKETEAVHKFKSNLEITFSPWILPSSPFPSPPPLNYCLQKLKQNVLGFSFV